MANTSDGKGDPPYSPHATIKTNAPSPYPPVAPRANNHSIPPETDRELLSNSSHDDELNFDFYKHADIEDANMLDNDATLDTDNGVKLPTTRGAVTAHSADTDTDGFAHNNNNEHMPDIVTEMSNYDTNSTLLYHTTTNATVDTDNNTPAVQPTADSSHPTTIDRILYPTTSEWDHSA